MSEKETVIKQVLRWLDEKWNLGLSKKEIGTVTGGICIVAGIVATLFL